MIGLKEYTKYSPFDTDIGLFIEDKFALEEFYKKVKQLPDKIQGLMIDMSTAEFIKKIVTDFRLTEEKGEEIARIIRDILLTDVYYKDLRNAVEKRLKIDENMAQQIADTINNQLFAPIMEELKKIQAPLEMPQKTAEATATHFEEPVPDENVIDLRNI